MTEGAYHAGNPASQPYLGTPANSKTGAAKSVTCIDAILRVLMVPSGYTGPIPCTQQCSRQTRWRYRHAA